MSVVVVRSGSVEEAVAVSRGVPEFDNPHEAAEYRKRITGKKHLILIACREGAPIGFKVGYQKETDGSFYSWMGGVLPAYRHLGVARQLASQQESWARENGFTKIRFKTRNRHKAMLVFALTRGFHILAVESRENIAENRILMEKQI